MSHLVLGSTLKKIVSATLLGLAFASAAQAATEAVNIAPNGDTIWSDDQYGNQAISANGSIAIIQGFALPPGQVPSYDPARKSPLWSRDRLARSTQMLSKNTAGQAANSYTIGGVSADGRYVAFDSLEDNLVAGDNNGLRDTFVVDRKTGQIKQVNVTNNGTPAGSSYAAAGAISADGRYVAFQSASSLLKQDTVNDSSSNPGVYVRDVVAGTTKRIDITSDNTAGTAASGWPIALFPQISGDGRFIAFFSSSTLTTNGTGLYLRDQLAKTTSALPISTPPANWSMSGNGRYIAYFYNNPSQGNGGDYNVYVLDRQSGTTETIYQGEYRTQPDANGWGNVILADRRPGGTVSVSANGRYVTFGVSDTKEGTWGTNVSYVYDRLTRKTANLADYGAPGRPTSEQTRAPGMQATLSGDGRHILVGRVALANPLFEDDGFCSMYSPYISE